MSDAITVSTPISGTDRTLTFETGKLAQLADGAVVARIGDTVLLATATASRSVREGADFFPLTVDIEERAYAAGKIPGSFFRREGKSSDQAILTCTAVIPPGHNAWVVGNEPCIMIDFTGMKDYARPLQVLKFPFYRIIAYSSSTNSECAFSLCQDAICNKSIPVL